MVGAPTSSNSNRLVEVARAHGADARLTEYAADIDPSWLEGASVIGVTAGASTPETLVEEVIERLQALGCEAVEGVKIVDERVRFTLPPELKQELRA